MFNYLEIADNLIDTVIEDINDTKYKQDTPKQISHPDPKPEEIEYWILLNQKKSFSMKQRLQVITLKLYCSVHI